MKTLNEVTIIGHVGQTPEVKESSGGKKFLPVSVATNTIIPQKEGDPKQVPEWHSVVFWGVLVELAAKMLKKGTPVFIRGRLRHYQTRDLVHDIIRYNTCVVAENFIVLNKRDQQQPDGDDLAAVVDEGSPSLVT